MLVNADNGRRFRPVNVTITLETEKEFKNFTEMIRFCDSIPEMLRKEEANCDADACGNMLSAIYNKLMGE
jgi:hypothetical protein